MKKRLWKRTLCCAVSAAMVLSATAVSAFAYIDRGDVKIEGDSSYTLQVGETVELSVSPYAEEHYPGCQMPECPEICAEKNCIEYVNGQQECVCNGKEMQLFEAVVTVDSSDSGVAETSYDGNGSITITAKSAGDAEITITAALREYNTAEETVSVTVQDDSGEQPGGGDDKDPGDDSGNGGSGNNGGSSGGGDSSETEQYTVIFESNGGSVGEKQTVADGQKVSRPEDPTKEGFVFEGWYTDSGMTTAYDFGSEVTESFTLYAKWAEKDADPVPEISFQDVPSDAWYAEYVTYLTEKSIVNGKTANTFAPNDFVTRAEFVKIIAGVAGADVTSAAGSSFSDVDAGAWYAPYVAWAAENGIVTGSGDKFNPNSRITRQDMAVIIDRYVEKLAPKKLENVNDKVDFADNSSISSYAADAVASMQQAGIISGKGANNFAPKDNATRAEACKMLAMVMQKTTEA